MPSCVLQGRWIAFYHLSFLRTILSCLSLSKSSWSMAPVVIRIPTLPVWIVEHAQKHFPSLSMSVPPSLKTLMPGQDIVTLATPFAHVQTSSSQLTTDQSAVTTQI